MSSCGPEDGEDQDGKHRHGWTGIEDNQAEETAGFGREQTEEVIKRGDGGVCSVKNNGAREGARLKKWGLG